ncbi:aromatic ring-hydroxylating dioxygenase subunit alpha [Sphingomonas sp. YL-JM2C]
MKLDLDRPAVDYREGVRMTPGVEAGPLAEKAPYVDHGTAPIDPRRYRDPAEAAREWEKMWTKVWTHAGFASDIPNPGDWFKYDLGPESFVVVRGQDDEIRAFYNVCPHRGNRIARTDFGTATDCFTCAFHGWKFGDDGALLSVKDPETFRPETLAHVTGLTAVRCEIWAGLVFINMDDDAEDLRSFLGILPEHLDAFHFEKMRVSEDIVYTYDANWKTTYDAFMEFYHADMIHPELGEAMETYWNQYDLYPKGISRMLLPFGYAPDKVADPDEVNEALVQTLVRYEGNPEDWKHLKGHEYATALVEVKRRLAEREGWDHFKELSDSQVLGDWNYSFFPNVTINIFGEMAYFQMFRPHPTDPMKCVWRSIQLNLVGANGFQPVLATGLGNDQDDPEDWDGTVRPPIVYAQTPEETGFILAQDCYLVPPVQEGINSRSFKGLILGEQEVRIRHYLAELDRYLEA